MMLKTKLFLGLFLLVVLAFSVFSFAYTDPNQVFSTSDIYWNFQQFMWQIGYHQRPLATVIFVIIIISLYTLYLKLIFLFEQRKVTFKTLVYITGISAGLLLIANPVLSHDIYNYLFNAKMVWFYKANPHIQVALDFPQDNWLRFMHNTHTPAPYGYGWTILSLIPSIIGANILKLTLLLFKLFIGAFFVILLFLQQKLGKLLKTSNLKKSISLFMLNPLVLIETFANGHNDVVMMTLAISSIWFGIHAIKTKKLLFCFPALLLFASSVSIKFATITIIGALLLFLILKNTKYKISFGGASSLAIFSPLLTARSQRFLPWYLIWPLSFLPLTSEKIIKNALLAFSFSSLLSYVPYLLNGQYTQSIITQRMLITFGLPIIYILLSILVSSFKSTNLSYNRSDK